MLPHPTVKSLGLLQEHEQLQFVVFVHHLAVLLFLQPMSRISTIKIRHYNMAILTSTYAGYSKFDTCLLLMQQHW